MTCIYDMHAVWIRSNYYNALLCTKFYYSLLVRYYFDSHFSCSLLLGSLSIGANMPPTIKKKKKVSVQTSNWYKHFAFVWQSFIGRVQKLLFALGKNCSLVNISYRISYTWFFTMGF